MVVVVAPAPSRWAYRRCGARDRSAARSKEMITHCVRQGLMTSSTCATTWSCPKPVRLSRLISINSVTSGRRVEQPQHIAQQRHAGAAKAFAKACGLGRVDAGHLRARMLEHAAGDAGGALQRVIVDDHRHAVAGSAARPVPGNARPVRAPIQKPASVFSGNSAALPRCATRCMSRAAFKNPVPCHQRPRARQPRRVSLVRAG